MTAPAAPDPWPQHRYRLHLLTETFTRLAATLPCSGLSPEDFCRALLRAAGNDALLRPLLLVSERSYGRPPLEQPSKPITTE